MQGEVDLDSPEYPALLQKIEDPPKKLFYKGDYDKEIFERCVAVVGSRKMTRYGRDVTEEIVEVLVSAGITVVSGFMYGVDAAAHVAALINHGRTIAVMPCGIDLIHPAYQRDLYEEILEKKGLIVSEYESTTPPAVWTYPRRNRIIAGLSDVTIIVEAGKESGSLITSGFAKEYGRKVFAVPGSIFNEVSFGTNKLINDYASILYSPDDIVSYFSDSKYILKKKVITTRKLSRKEKNILAEIKNIPMSMDDLSRSLKMDVATLSMTVSILQLDGLIYEEGGKLYAD